MAGSTRLRLRAAWFQLHKWLGILLAVLVIPISLSGAALVWHDWLDQSLNPGRYAVTSHARPQPVSVYAAAARAALKPGERIATIRYPEHGGPVVVTAVSAAGPGGGGGGGGGRGAPRTSLWLDPADGRLLDRAGGNDGPVRFLHGLHGSLQMPGVGRQIVGWVGVAMLFSSLTGLWLWWPVTGSWRRGLRWRRQSTTNANLHHMAGFWIAIPLTMLSLTGAWISFPAFFGRLSGAPVQGGPGGPGGAGRPLDFVTTSADAAISAAGPYATGPLVSVAWPTDKAPVWKVAFQRSGGPAEVAVADSTGAASPPKPPRPETLARTMRRLHDGTGMGPLWQAIIFVGGLLPALLAVTGIVMWLRTRGWRAQAARRRRDRREALAGK